jgi:hypothetical protein
MHIDIFFINRKALQELEMTLASNSSSISFLEAWSKEGIAYLGYEKRTEKSQYIRK